MRNLLDRGERVLALSLHSSSLAIGQNPYVRTTADLHRFYDRLSAMLDTLSHRFSVRFVQPLELLALLADE